MNNLPFVSIILPVRNESASIEIGLHAIFKQDYPANQMEILIADGMSMDDTRKIINGFSAQHPDLRIQILDNHSMIVPAGINIALRRARGEIIIRVDGHTLIASDYVRRCVETLHRTQADNVGGKMNATGTTTFEKALALATSSPFGIGNASFHYSDEEKLVDTVYMGAWPRMVFEKAGLFDEELVRDQDDEFNYRLRSAGGKILLSPKIKSEYKVRGSPGALWKQYYEYGFWKIRVLQKHPRQMSLRQFVPPTFVFAVMSSGILVLFTSLYLLSLVVPVFYMIANIVASVLVASKRGWRYLHWLPFIFAILHLSYGLGFLAGLVKFWDRWSDKTGRVPLWLHETIG